MELDAIIEQYLKTATFVIELDVFSGRPNPISSVNESKEQLMEKFFDHRTFQSTGLASTLGYKGFIIHKRTSPKGATLEVSRLTVGRGKNDKLERWLLQMFPVPDPDSLPRDPLPYWPLFPSRIMIYKPVYTHVMECIDAVAQRRADREEKMGSGDLTDFYQRPEYNPDLWNINAVARRNNSSYNYATNIRTDTFAVPGRFNGGNKSSTAQDVIDGCQADGLIECNDGKPPSDNENTGAIALAIWPYKEGSTDLNGWIHDYTFYRQDSDKMWSYKQGKNCVINTDDIGNKISDPSKAARGPFTFFVGYFGRSPDMLIC